jgi:uncharacterized membrane protein YphA (DoxX/SURF4 family)
VLTARSRTILAWIAQVVAAGILGMAGVLKLTAAPDPVALFTLLGAEPWCRLLVGTLEVAATLLLLWPTTARVGAGLGAALMLGAIGTHLVKIGVFYGGDPSLFIMACVVLSACAATAWLPKPT